MSSRILALLNGGGEPAPDAQVEHLSEAVDDLQPTVRAPAGAAHRDARGRPSQTSSSWLLRIYVFAPSQASQFPKELVAYSLMRTGFNCTDPRVSRLVALAAQKFITEISDDALQFCKIRQQNPALRDKQRGKEKRLVLTMDDLSAALRDYGVSLRKPDYFADRADGA